MFAWLKPYLAKLLSYPSVQWSIRSLNKGLALAQLTYYRFVNPDKYQKIINYVPPERVKSHIELIEEVYQAKLKKCLDLPSEQANQNIEPELYDIDWYVDNEWTKTNIKPDENPIQQHWKRNYLIDATTQGNVIMAYNVYQAAFIYYADFTVTEKWLNEIALKYVLKFKCRDFYQFNDDQEIVSPFPKLLEECEKQLKELTPKKTSDISIQPPSKQYPHLFVKPKPVIVKVKALGALHQMLRDRLTKGQRPRPLAHLIQSKNKFIKVGKVREFNPLNNPIKQQENQANYLVFADLTNKMDIAFGKQEDAQETRQQYSVNGPRTENYSYADFMKEQKAKDAKEAKEGGFHLVEPEELPKEPKDDDDDDDEDEVETTEMLELLHPQPNKPITVKWNENEEEAMVNEHYMALL
jgi:hypothetical protein